MTTTAPVPATDGAAERAAPVGATSRRALLLHAVGLPAFVAAALLGRATVLDGATLSLLWPAGGVAAVWIFLSRGREVWVTGGLVAVAAGASNYLTGAGAGMTAVFVVSNLVQTLVFLLVVRRTVPDLWPHGTQSLAAIAPLGWVTLASVAAAGAGALSGYAGWSLVQGSPPVETLLIWAGRNFAGVLSVFAVVLLVAFRLLRGGRTRQVPLWEWALMTGLTLLVYLPIFVQDTYSFAFVAVSATMVVGLRSDAVVAVVHALLGGSVAVAATVLGHGPFSLEPDADHRSLLVQLFLTAVLLSGVFLSAAREEREGAMRALAEERERVTQQAEILVAAVDNVTDGVIVVDAEGSILNANDAARRVLDLVTDDPSVVGRATMRHLDGTPLPRDRMPVVRALRGETVSAEDVVILDKDGRPLTFTTHANPLASAGRARVVASFRDVTDERAQVHELSTFAGVVAHDLRGPLAALQGWADLAAQVATAEDDLPEDLRTALERIRSSSTRLAGLLDSLLVHATARDRTLAREPVDLAGLAREAAVARGAEARVEVGTAPLVLGDAVMLRHLVDNLVANALKFVTDGVVPRVVVAGRQEGRWVELTVTDNGIGVPEEMRRAVFQRFERVGGTGRQGTGLGLSICRTIAERHGGDVGVAPGPDGHGSTFTVRLPAVPADEPVGR